MEIIRPLGDHEWADRVLANHLQHLRPTLDALLEWTKSVDDEPESFWEGQRVAIWAKISAREKKRTNWLFALAGTLALIVLAVSTLFLNPQPATAPSEAQIDSDHELLVHVEQTIESGGPQALEPAALLAREISQDANSLASVRGLSKGEKHP
jgi:hypothetical protein